MLNQEQIEIIKKTIEDFFKKTSFETSVEFLPQEELTLPVNVKTDEPQILIGEGGQTLVEIQYLLKLILRKKISEQFYINLDINDYKKKKGEYLKELARSAAEEVALIKREKALSPMSAYERRIVHMELAKREDIETESIGEEPERRILIRPKS